MHWRAMRGGAWKPTLCAVWSSGSLCAMRGAVLKDSDPRPPQHFALILYLHCKDACEIVAMMHAKSTLWV
jgi:hypothetical protein